MISKIIQGILEFLFCLFIEIFLWCPRGILGHEQFLLHPFRDGMGIARQFIAGNW
jgi:hypothetical protein